MRKRKVLIIGAFIVINWAYFYHYYGDFNLSAFSSYIVNFTDKLIEFIIQGTQSWFSYEVVITLIISATIIYIISISEVFDRILEIIGRVKNFEWGDLKISTEEIAQRIQEEESELEKVSEKNSLTEIEEKRKQETEKRICILEALVKSPDIAKVVDESMKKGYTNMRLSLRRLPPNLKISEVNKIFETETKNGQLIIKNIKPGIQDIVMDVINELRSQGVIY